MALSAQTPGKQVLHGHIPATISRSTPLGRVPADKPLRLCIGLPIRNQDTLNTLIHDLYDPTSPHFRQFLTPDQFNARFAPTAQDYATIISFAKAHGLTVAETYQNHRLLDVSGSAANVEQAFQVTLREYRHPTEDRTFFAPDTEPSVETGVPMADIWGLSDYPKPHPLLHPKSVQPLRSVISNAGTGPSGSYRGYDFRNTYTPDATNLTGAGQILGLFQADGFFTNDITTYISQAGLPNVPISTVLLDGFSGVPASTNGNAEVSLDIEMVISMAPGLSNVIVYEGNPVSFYPSHILSRIVSDNLAKQVSSSWSWDGGPTTTTDSYLQQMAAQGQSYFQASGDSDAYLFGAMDNTINTTTPVDSPYVTSVGGTTLTTSPGAAWQSEKVWNWGGDVGSSGGISSYYLIPVWQQGISMTSNQGSTQYRNIPDVAMNADNVYVCYLNGAVDYFGGTSCAAPLWAGFCALVNQKAAAGKLAPVGFLNPALYRIGKGSGYSNAFHDITSGDNTSSTSPTNFYAVSGFDLCTGWGTPNGMGLIDALLPLHLFLMSTQLSDSEGGNGNHFPDPGEVIQETITWTNDSSVNASNIQASLTTTANGVTILQGTSAYPNIPALSSSTNMTLFSYRLAKTLAAGTVLEFTNVLSTGSLIFTNSFSRVVGEPPGAADFAVTNVAGIKIPANSTIYVTNFMNAYNTGIVGFVTTSVRLDFNHDSSLIIGLQHPDGTEVILARSRGGTGANYGSGYPPAAMEYTGFNDLDSTAISNGTAPFIGTYHPDGLLSNFVGKGVNGTWRLRLTNTSSSSHWSGTFYSWEVSLLLAPPYYTAWLFHHPPVASNLNVTVAAKVPTNLVLSASDADDNPLTFSIVTPPVHGSVSQLDTNTGSLVYTASGTGPGLDTFTFTASDGFTNSPPAAVSVTVKMVPSVPEGTMFMVF